MTVWRFWVIKAREKRHEFIAPHETWTQASETWLGGVTMMSACADVL